MTFRVEAQYDADASGFIAGTRQARDALVDFKKGTGQTRDELGRLKATSQQATDKVVGLKKGTDTAARSLHQAARAADVAGNETEQLARKTQRAERATLGFGSQLGRLRGLIAGVGVGLLAREALSTGLAFERMSARFQTAAGGIAAGEAAMETARGTAERFGLDMMAVERGLSGLLASSRGTAIEDQAVEIFEGVATAAAALQLPGEQVQGTLTAIEQIMSKGKVQAEELRGQLGERLPGAFQIAARSMGVTTAELDKMLQSGEVLAEDFLPRFARQLRTEFGEGADAAADGAAAIATRFRNALVEDLRIFSSDGFMDGATDGMLALTDVLRDPGTQAAIRNFGRVLGEGLSFAAENAENLTMAIGGLAGLRFASMAIGWARAARQAAGGVGALTLAMRGLSSPLMVLSVAATALPFVFESSDEKMAALRDTTRTAAGTLRDYAEASRQAAREQAEMGGAVSDTTTRLLAQTRAQLQEEMAAARRARDDVLADVRGRSGLLDVSDITMPRAELFREAFADVMATGNREMIQAFTQAGGIAAPETLGPVFGDLVAMLNELEIGNDTVLPQLVRAFERVAGAGDEVSRVAGQVGTELAQMGRVDPETQTELLRLANVLGGLDEQIAAINEAGTDGARAEALAALAGHLDRMARAGAILRNDGAGLASMLKEAGASEAKISEINAILDGTVDLTEDVAEGAGEIDFTGAANTAGALAGELERATRALDGLQRGQSGLEAANAGLKARLEALRGGAQPDAARIEGQLAEDRASIGPLADLGSGPDDGSRGADAALDVLHRRGAVLRDNLELQRLISDLENEGRGGGGSGRSVDLASEIIGEFGERFGATFEQSSRKIEDWRTRTIAALEAAGVAHSGMADMVDQIARDRLSEAYRADLDNRTDWAAGVERALADIGSAHGDMADIAEGFVTTSFQTMEDAFVSLATTGKVETKDMVDFVLRQIWRMGMEMASGQFQMSGGSGGGGWIGNLIGSFFGMGVGMSTQASTAAAGLPSVFDSTGAIALPQFHEGGNVRDGRATRVVSASVFDGAKRLHIGGLAGNEVPAILEDDERVLTMAQQEATAATIRGLASLATAPVAAPVQATGGVPLVNVNIIGASSEPQIEQRSNGNGIDIDVIFGEIEGRMARNTAEGRGLAPAIAGRFNLRQGGL